MKKTSYYLKRCTQKALAITPWEKEAYRLYYYFLFEVLRINPVPPTEKEAYRLYYYFLGTIDKDALKRKAAVARAKSEQEVRNIAASVGFAYFLDYDDQIATKHREFESAINYYGINLQDETVLDIGPGTADSLDCARKMRASKTLFVEKEHVFVKFAEVKGHKGYARDYTFQPYFPWTLKEKIEVVYTKGSINCEWVNRQHALIEQNSPDGYFDFGEWIDAMLKLLKPGKGQIILVPAMDRQAERIIDPDYDLDTYYWCPDVEKYKQSYFVQTLLKKGFTMADSILGFTQQKAFPLSFHYQNF